MKLDYNLIEDHKKHNNEKNNLSVKGYYWYEKKNDHSEINILKNELSLDSCIAKLAVSRGIKSSNFINYTEPKIKTLIPDPFVLDDMQKGTAKIIECIKKKNKIGIFGDYDVDGSSATAILCNYFSEIGVEYEYHIPDRIKEGYGPNIEAFLSLKEKDCKLILTLDCGITALKSIKHIKNEGVEVIVVDHHMEADSLPEAYAIINPNKKSDSSKLDNLCATGVVFFLIISINRELKKLDYYKSNLPNLIKYLDLVALATICDLVKLDNINRAFVKQGIKVINKTKNIGLKSLLEESSINQPINEYHLGFIVGPRINAGGRVGDSRIGVKLLTSNEKPLSNILSKKLCNFNNLRRSIEKKVENDAMSKVTVDEEEIICVNSKNWHPGVIGIVAARLTEKFNRPSIVISEESNTCSASCRSVKSFDIGKLIVDLVGEGILLSGGGHKMAGGFKIKSCMLDKLKFYLKKKFSKSNKDLIKTFESHLKISLIKNKLYHDVNKFSPFGIGNPKPRFMINDCFIKHPRIVADKHLSFFIEDSYSNNIKVISFNSLGTELGNIIQTSKLIKGMIVTLSLNSWGGEEKTELMIEDIIL